MCFYKSNTDDPFDNVIKIKPPLTVTQSNVDEFVEKLRSLLEFV